MRERVLDALDPATDGGRLPVVSDASSCTEGFQRLVAAAAPAIRVLDAVTFVADQVLARLPAPARRLPSLVLHPTCSSTRLGLDAALLRIARTVADDVVVPDDWQCCAFAGDRGLLHPELTASATRVEAASVAGAEFAAHASVNRTCELAHDPRHGQDLPAPARTPRRGDPRAAPGGRRHRLTVRCDRDRDRDRAGGAARPAIP